MNQDNNVIEHAATKCITVEEAMKQGSGEVHLHGWVYRERKSNKMCFVVLRDSTNIIQCVIRRDDVNDAIWDAANSASMESSIELRGIIKKDERAPTGFEVLVNDFKLLHRAEAFPITKDQSTEFLLDVRHLWLRSRKLTHAMRIKSVLLQAGREYFLQQKWFETTPPIITSSSCEGGSTLFELEYFGQKAYLSQSAQLYLESLIFSLERVWALTPSFRAEKSRTNRHLAEYWHLEGEAAWMDFEALTKFLEGLISHMAQQVAQHCADDLKAWDRNVEDLKKITPPFPRITYTQALEILKKDGMEVEWGKDLRTLEEEQLMKHYDKPLIVTHYPKEVKAFYMKNDPNQKDVVLCCDVLAPEGFGEIVGASERETNYDVLVDKITKQGEDIKHYEWYLDLRKYGSVPHSGFGLGIERVLRWFCKMENIRDTIPYPRTMSRAYP